MTANQLLEFNQARDNAFVSRIILPALQAEINTHEVGTRKWEVLFHSIQECNKVVRAFEEMAGLNLLSKVTA